MKEAKSDFIDTLPLARKEVPADEALDATLATRALYCLALLTLILGPLVQSAWVSLGVGGGPLVWFGTTLFSLILGATLYRIYLVMRYSSSLRARKPNLFGRMFRALGLLVMFLAALGLLASVFVRPLTLLLFKTAGENGIGYFVVGMYAAMVSSFGWVGCALFEVSRIMGRRGASPDLPRPLRQRKQNLIFGCVLITAALALPYLVNLVAGTPCLGSTQLRCVAQVSGGVKRLVAAPLGSAVRLESNIDEIAFVNSAQPSRARLRENISLSLLKTGHPAQAEGPPILVTVKAATVDKGVVVTLQVLDAQGEAASFVTAIKKHARLEAGSNGKQVLVVEVRPRVMISMPAQTIDPATQQAHFLDEMFSQMRQSVVTPLEQAEQARKLVRTVVERTVVDLPERAKLDDARPAESCRNILKLTQDAHHETSLPPFPGAPLRHVRFVTAANADSYALAQLTERIGCNAEGVWAYHYSSITQKLEIRRFSNAGDLLAYVSTSLPVDKRQSVWVDVESAKVEGGRVTFSAVSVPITGGWKRRVFEVDL